MITVQPFPALRPRPETAAAVAAVPYDVVNAAEAAVLADGNANSFLHVSRAEIDLPAGTNPYAETVYERAADNFQRLQSVMVQDAEPALYFYRLRMGGHEQTGLAGCFSVDEYNRGDVKKHETTRKDKEDDRTRHIVRLRAQTGPVFLTYRALPAMDAAATRACSRPPLYDFIAPDGVGHTIWKVDAGLCDDIVRAFATLPAIYIADGHHRAASAARAHARFADENKANMNAAHAQFLAVAFPDSQTQILPYNRLVKDLAGLSPTRFLADVQTRFAVAPGPASPRRKGECGMFLAGRWYTLTLRPAGDPTPPDPIESLDVSLLQNGLLEPILKVVDPRTDKRIDFVGGIRGTAELEQAVSRGAAAVAFSMFPVTVGELMAIADAGSIMPPKSTWFEPKLRDGLLIHLI
ncbi:MAG: DUF1015 domain-containing protein [Vicinamibacterales bacterium]